MSAQRDFTSHELVTTFTAFSYLVFYEVMEEEIKLPSFLIQITIPWDMMEGTVYSIHLKIWAYCDSA